MKHYIIVKFIDGYDYNNQLENINTLFAKAKEVDGVQNVIVKITNSNRNKRYDLMIEMELTENGLDNFDNSWIHKEWKSCYGESILNKVIFDCD